MNTNIFGYLAAITSFFTLLPQIYRTYKSKSAEDISILMWIFLCITNILWLTHGIVIKDLPLIITNTFATVADITMIVLKIKYSKN